MMDTIRVHHFYDKLSLPRAASTSDLVLRSAQWFAMTNKSGG